MHTLSFENVDGDKVTLTLKSTLGTYLVINDGNKREAFIPAEDLEKFLAAVSYLKALVNEN